jgi:hypothetical protein
MELAYFLLGEQARYPSSCEALSCQSREGMEQSFHLCFRIPTLRLRDINKPGWTSGT